MTEALASPTPGDSRGTPAAVGRRPSSRPPPRCRRRRAGRRSRAGPRDGGGEAVLPPPPSPHALFLHRSSRSAPVSSGGFVRRRERPPPAVFPRQLRVMDLPPDAAPPDALVRSAHLDLGHGRWCCSPASLPWRPGAPSLLRLPSTPTPTTRPSVVAGLWWSHFSTGSGVFGWPHQPAPRALSLRPHAGRDAPRPRLCVLQPGVLLLLWPSVARFTAHGCLALRWWVADLLRLRGGGGTAG